MYFLYEIKFPDGYFYIGITKNLKLRFSQHKRSKYPVGVKIRESGLSEKELYNIIFSSDNQLDIIELEEFLVDEELLKNKKCLNIATGEAKGGYFKNKKHTKISKSKISLSHQKAEKHHKAKAILCFDVYNNFIDEFGSIKIASDYFGIPPCYISKILRGTIKNPSRFIFKYKKLTGTN